MDIPEQMGVTIVAKKYIVGKGGYNMKFQGALIKEQGVTFGIVIVRPHVLNNSAERERMQQFGTKIFGLVTIILMAQNSRGVPTYYGRHDIVNFLSKVHISRIPWREYTVA